MLKIEPLKAFTDNYIWLLKNHYSKEVAVIDPGTDIPVMEWLKKNPDWVLKTILITHHHSDHTGGVTTIKEQTKANVFGPNLTFKNIDQPLKEQDQINILGYNFSIIETPGHTKDHICYFNNELKEPILFCGDTLFSSGCGRVFEGTYKEMLLSLKKLSSLPENTLLYCTHEYTINNLLFSKTLEPNNSDINTHLKKSRHLQKINQPTLPSNIKLEKKINPFLRCNERIIIDQITNKLHKLPKDELEVFTFLREWKNDF